MNYKEKIIKSNCIYIGFNNFLTSHDFSITVIQNNKVKAVELERINRLKCSPEEINIGNLELGLSNINKKKYFEKTLKTIIDGLNISTINNSIIYIVNAPFEIELFLDDITIFYSKCLEHHYAHSCSSYYPSSFDESAILTLDWVGRDSRLNKLLTQSIWYGKGIDIKYLEGNEYSRDKNGIGMVYSLFSELICLGEGSVMGLSSYGNSNKFNDINIYEYTNNEVFLNSIFLDNTDNIKSNYKCLLACISFKEKIISNIKNIFGIKCIDYKYINGDITKSIFADIAAKLQDDTEKAIIFLANRAYFLTKSKNLCLAGGVALNVIANTKILNKTPFENIFIQPAAKDSGLSLGLAYYAYHVLGKEKNRIPLLSPGIGYEYSNDIINSLNKFKKYIDFNKEKNIYNIVAKKLSNNDIIGWFSGGSEFGPRSLGFRSILASPISKKMGDRVNNIKNRQKWRPLAPILLEEDFYEYFENCIPNGYMTFIGKIKKNKLKKVPSIVHIDGSARYQTVNIDQNNKIYKLISEFKKITGESILINTSLNVAKEPIAETPEDAIKIFLSTDIDYLVLENYLIRKKAKIYKFNYDINKLRIYNMNYIGFTKNELNINILKNKYIEIVQLFFKISKTYIVNLTFSKNNCTIFYSSNIIISLFIYKNYNEKYNLKIGKIAFCYSYKNGYNKKNSDYIIDIFSNSIRFKNIKIYRFLKTIK